VITAYTYTVSLTTYPLSMLLPGITDSPYLFNPVTIINCHYLTSFHWPWWLRGRPILGGEHYDVVKSI